MLKTLAAACCAALISVPAVAHTAPAPADRIAPSVFAQLPFMSRPDLSPNGQHVATTLRVGDEQYLAIVALGEKGEPRIIQSGENHDILWWNWLDDDYLVVAITFKDYFGNQEVPVSRLISVERATGKVIPLGWDNAAISASTVLWTSREGPPRLLLQRTSRAYGYEQLGTPEVVEVDVRTGREKVVVRPRHGIGGWQADGNGLVRFGTGFDRDTGKLTYLHRERDGEVFKRLDKVDLNDDDTPIIPVLFLPQKGKALAYDDKDGFSKLYELDLATMQTGRLIYGVDGYDLDGIITNPEQTEIDGINVTQDSAGVVWMDEEMKAVQAKIDAKVGAGNSQMASFDRARKRFIVHVGGPSQAGGYWLYDVDGDRMQRLGWTNEALKLEPLNPVSTVRYRARDGLMIPAVLTLPRHVEKRENLPLVVMPHGGPAARDEERYDWWAQAIAELGYVVIQPNYRGSSGFGTEWEKKSENQWGLAMQDDLNDAVNYLAGRGIADPKRVCVVGWSYGGYAAFRAAQRDGNLFRCTVAGAGVPDMPAMKRYDRNYLGKYGTKFIGSGADDLRSTSPQYFPEQFSSPILIVHGVKDARVPVSQSREMAKALKRAGKVEDRDFRYIEQPEGDHNQRRLEDRVQWIEEVVAWLRKYNPA